MGADDPGNVRPVFKITSTTCSAVLTDEVVPVYIIDPPVWWFVIDSIVRNLVRVRPDVRCKVQMIAIEACVEKPDFEFLTPGPEIPGLYSTYVRARGPRAKIAIATA